jgi:hypothetical protein
MDGLKLVFYCLVGVFIITLIHRYRLSFVDRIEGFASPSDSLPRSVVEQTIRSALDKYLNTDMCLIVIQLRTVIAQNIQGNQNTPTADTLAKVDEYLTREIGIAPIQCPAFTYPTANSEVEWLVFLSGIPTNIGAAYILMAIYAQQQLSFYAKKVKTAIATGKVIPESENGQAERIRIENARAYDRGLQSVSRMGGIIPVNRYILSAMPTEGFESIIGLCPATVQDTRRAEKKNKENESCIMPEDMSHEEIVKAVDTLLQKMLADTRSILAEKYISPTIDTVPFIQDAKVNAEYLKSTMVKALDGSLLTDIMDAATTT